MIKPLYTRAQSAWMISKLCEVTYHSTMLDDQSLRPCHNNSAE